jgi:hypothetical protein
MNKLSKKILLPFILCNYFIYSQTLLKGKLFDKETNSAIVYADIYVLDTSIGVITNEDGEFYLNIPKAYENNTLVLSSLGYEKLQFPINKLLNKSENNFYLEQKSENLDEVIINSVPIYTVSELFRMALSKYSNDFSKNEYIAKGFIRHSEKTKSEFKFLVEAAFEMYEPGSDDNIRINLLQTRKSIDNRILDTVFVIVPYLKDKNNSGYNKNHDIAVNYKNNMSKKELENAIAFYDNHYTARYNKELGLLDKILSTDINKVRNYNKKRATLTDKELTKFIIKKDTILYMDNEKVTKVSFTLPNKKSRNILVGSMFIRNSDFAILETNFSSLYAKSHSFYKATGNRVRYSTKIKYKGFDNVMYPFFISHKSFKINVINKVSLGGTFTLEEILFTKIINNKESISVFKLDTKTNSNIFNNTKYNKEFWDNYTVLLESKEEKKLIQDLEKKISLKNQFQR